jgi:flagellar biosynthesis protein FliQ
MNTFTLSLRNSAIILIAFCIISVVVHLVFAFMDYNNEALSFLVKKTPDAQIENFNGLKFKSKQVGEIEIKPTKMQSVILENGIYKDGGATMLFYLISCFGVLKMIKKGNITLESLTEKNIAKILWIVAGLFFLLKFLSRMLLNEYVDRLTTGQFNHYDNLQGFFGFAVPGIIIFNAVYSLIEYSKKLKQENDLTI